MYWALIWTLKCHVDNVQKSGAIDRSRIHNRRVQPMNECYGEVSAVQMACSQSTRMPQFSSSLSGYIKIFPGLMSRWRFPATKCMVWCAKFSVTVSSFAIEPASAHFWNRMCGYSRDWKWWGLLLSSNPTLEVWFKLLDGKRKSWISPLVLDSLVSQPDFS